MTAAEYLAKYMPDEICKVNGNPVWDYKTTENDGTIELRLISENVPGSENYEQVTCKELAEFVGIWTNATVIDETTGKAL